MKQEDELDKLLISKVLKYINKVDEVEQYFAFEAINGEIILHVKAIDKLGVFNNWYNNKELKKKAKNYYKKDFKKQMFSNLHIHAETEIDNIKYKLLTKVSGPLKSYSEAIIKKKIRKFINKAKLMYVKLDKITNDKEETIFELGDKGTGHVHDKISI